MKRLHILMAILIVGALSGVISANMISVQTPEFDDELDGRERAAAQPCWPEVPDEVSFLPTGHYFDPRRCSLAPNDPDTPDCSHLEIGGARYLFDNRPSVQDCQYVVSGYGRECPDGMLWDALLNRCADGDIFGSSPILIDIAGNGFSLTNAANGVRFDIDGDQQKDKLSWTKADTDDAWLALDRNNNGLIDDGTELFGNFTAQAPKPKRNGFSALAEYDKPENGGNRNGQMDSKDKIFDSLRLWQDVNHNGISEPKELHTLPSFHVMVIDLDYKESNRHDEHWNWFAYQSRVLDSKGAQLDRWAWDVFLIKGRS
jgi:hypothetical protein